MDGILRSCINKDDLNIYELCSFLDKDNVCEYKDGENFSVIQDIGFNNRLVAIPLLGIVKIKICSNVNMGDILAEYKHKQLVRKYRKVAYIKRLIALEDGISGDIIYAQIVM